MNTLIALTLWAATAATPDAVTVFEAGEGAYACYRIPAIVQTDSGVLLAFAEARLVSCSDTGQIDTVLRRSTDGGLTWGPMQVVASADGYTVGNPAPVIDRTTGRILLPLTRNGANDRERDIHLGVAPPRTVWITHSDDDGETWAPLRDISSEARREDWRWYATGPGHAIQLSSGRLLVPCDHSTDAEFERWHSHAILSDDGGETWRIGGIVDGFTNECMAAELPDGSIYLNARSYRGNNLRLVSRSTDGGETWSRAVEEAALVEPVCQASVLYHDASGLLLFANPASTRRVMLTLRASEDEGDSWPHAAVLHTGPSAYSDLVAMDEHTIGCLYERGERNPYERIVFTRVSLRDLRRAN